MAVRRDRLGGRPVLGAAALGDADPVRDRRGRLPAEGAVQDPPRVRHAVGRARRSSPIYSVFILGPFQSLVVVDVTIYAAALLMEFVALVVLRIHEPDMERPYRIPGGWFGHRPGGHLPGRRSSRSRCYNQVLEEGWFARRRARGARSRAAGRSCIRSRSYFKKRARRDRATLCPRWRRPRWRRAAMSDRSGEHWLPGEARRRSRSRIPEFEGVDPHGACPVDGSPGSEVGLAWASEIARVREAAIVVVVAFDPPHAIRRRGILETEHLRTEMETRGDRAGGGGRASCSSPAGTGRARLVCVGEPTEAILDTAEQEHADLIVIGRRGLRASQGPAGRLRVGARRAPRAGPGLPGRARGGDEDGRGRCSRARSFLAGGRGRRARPARGAAARRRVRGRSSSSSFQNWTRLHRPVDPRHVPPQESDPPSRTRRTSSNDELQRRLVGATAARRRGRTGADVRPDRAVVDFARQFHELWPPRAGPTRRLPVERRQPRSRRSASQSFDPRQHVHDPVGHRHDAIGYDRRGRRNRRIGTCSRTSATRADDGADEERDAFGAALLSLGLDPNTTSQQEIDAAARSTVEVEA